MSLKENVDFIKDEITTEEKFVEGFFKLEKFWKKYKVVTIATISVVIILVTGISINNYLTKQNNINANIAFNELLDNPENKDAQEQLKNINPTLFSIANYINSSKNNKTVVTDVEYLKQISQFNVALNKNDIDAINTISLDPKFLLKEYALFQKALMQTLNKDYKSAKTTLTLIPSNSSVAQLSNQLSHYLLTK